MTSQDRKTFLRTLGFLGASALLTNATAAPILPQSNENTAPPDNTEPRISGAARRVLRVANLTDIHVKNERVAEYGMAAALHAVNEMKDKPDFIINGGDAIMNITAISKETVRSQWQTFQRVLKNENSLPVHHCIGNHDLYGFMFPDSDHAESKKWAMEEYALPKPYYSFTQRGWKFIVLDSIHGRKSVPGYFGKLDDEQFLWLKNELKNTPSEINVCIVSHIPILAICCVFDRDITNRDPRRISDSSMHADSSELVNLFFEHKNVRACLSGHIHLVDYVNYLGVEYFCNGAVAGEWWKGRHQQFDPAFCIMNFFDDGTVTREVNYYKWSV